MISIESKLQLIRSIMMQATILHFHHEIPLPQSCSIKPYEHPIASQNKKKNKTKLTKFTYYKTPNNIKKILFIDDDHYIDQGVYPFTDPDGNIYSFADIGNVERLITTEAVYIGHYNEGQEGNQQLRLVLKKMGQVKVDLETSQVETEDDHFEVLNVGNEERFKQFLKIQLCNKNSLQTSIRVIIGPKADIIDYQFFQREGNLKKNRVPTEKKLK